MCEAGERGQCRCTSAVLIARGRGAFYSHSPESRVLCPGREARELRTKASKKQFQLSRHIATWGAATCHRELAPRRPNMTSAGSVAHLALQGDGQDINALLAESKAHRDDEEKRHDVTFTTLMRMFVC